MGEFDDGEYFSANLTSIGQSYQLDGADHIDDFTINIITQPWLLVTDQIVGDELEKTYEQVQLCHNFTASVPYYQPQLEPLEGYHHFIAGEFACIKEFVWQCLDANCNDIMPNNDENANSWEILGVWASYQVGDPTIIDCQFMYDNYIVGEHPSFVAYNFMCDYSDYTAMEVHMCKNLTEGGINCNNHWKYDENTVTSTQAEIDAAWEITDYGNEVLMLYAGAPLFEMWWNDPEQPNNIDAELVR